MLKTTRKHEWERFVYFDKGTKIEKHFRLIEDFIEEGFEIYLYNRFFNWEVTSSYLLIIWLIYEWYFEKLTTEALWKMIIHPLQYAAQYLLKNNERGRNWLREFSGYEFLVILYILWTQNRSTGLRFSNIARTWESIYFTQRSHVG